MEATKEPRACVFGKGSKITLKFVYFLTPDGLPYLMNLPRVCGQGKRANTGTHAAAAAIATVRRAPATAVSTIVAAAMSWFQSCYGRGNNN